MTALDVADRLVVLQPLALAELPRAHRQKATVILQSVEPISYQPTRRRTFRIVVVGHLRSVKDPFRTAMAVRKLPTSSRIEVLHFGAALSDSMRRRAVQEQARNSRYRWMGDRARSTVMRALGTGDLCALTSRSEGGANVVGEAIVMGTPVVSSRIAGSLGLLGLRYPGCFPVGNTAALTKLLLRSETDPLFYGRLRSACAQLAPMFDPERERNAFVRLFSRME
jgi:glycosyltransferase involved in cell wall biosynthesis